MREVTRGIRRIPTNFANLYFVELKNRSWVMVDGGVPGYTARVRRAAEHYYGNIKPAAIVLTHGHFDHVGSIKQLAQEWNVPIYAHRMEFPYLTGRSDYPPPDPTVGGFLALVSRFSPSHAHDFSGRLRPLSSQFGSGWEGTIAEMPGWRWIHTPGHAPGHISLFRESDGALIAGDAFATVGFDSYIGAITGSRKLSRIGTPFIYDWEAARLSAIALSELHPRVVACGHGIPMKGHGVARRLEHFAQNFPIPRHGRYVRQPAVVNEDGVAWLPPEPFDLRKAALGVGTALLVGCVAAKRSNGKSDRFSSTTPRFNEVSAMQEEPRYAERV